MLRLLAGLAFIGAAVRLNRSGSDALGTIPPPPTGELFCPWVKQTFSRVWSFESGGVEWRPTRVKSTRDLQTTDGKWLPAGTKMDVAFVDCYRGDETSTIHLRAEVAEQLFISSSIKVYELTVIIDSTSPIPFDVLDDNWGDLVVSSKRSYKAGWVPKTQRRGRP